MKPIIALVYMVSLAAAFCGVVFWIGAWASNNLIPIMIVAVITGIIAARD